MFMPPHIVVAREVIYYMLELAGEAELHAELGLLRAG